MDIALIRDGVVVAVARDTTDEAVFGGDPGVIVQFAPGEVAAGKLWDGDVLSDPPPPVPVVTPPQLIEMGKAKLQMLATPWPPVDPTTTLWAEVKALAAADEELAIELSRPYLSRTRDKTLALQAYFGLSDEAVDAMFTAAAARP